MFGCVQANLVIPVSDDTYSQVGVPVKCFWKRKLRLKHSFDCGDLCAECSIHYQQTEQFSARSTVVPPKASADTDATLNRCELKRLKAGG